MNADGKSSRRKARAAPASHDGSAAFLAGVGERVRRMRALRGMSRKVLAQVSGISERYIAQMESGQGNVSIVLLRRVAEAAATPIEDLLSDPAQRPDDWPLLRDLLLRASPETLTEVRSVLAGRVQGQSPPQHRIAVDRVALIGLRGAGKSTLGRRAAEHLGWPFVEINREVEEESGFSVAEVFELYGLEGYRRLEHACLSRIVERPGPMIVAAGGGAVADPATFDLLLSAFFTVWVKAAPTEHMERVRAQGDLRPMGSDKGAMTDLVAILSSREPLYARARATLDTSGVSVDTSLEALLALIRGYCATGCPWISVNR